MKDYCYFLIPDAMAWDVPALRDKKMPTEFYKDLADVKLRYQQLREQPYNYEYASDYVTGCPYARLTIGIVRNNARGPLKLVEVRGGVNYLSDDFYGPFSDVHDKMLYAMARDLIEAVGVDRIRIFNDSLAMPLRSRDMCITEWRVPNDICSDLKFSRFLNRDKQQLFLIRDGERVIETSPDGTQQTRVVKNIDSTHIYIGHYGCHIQQYAEDNFRTGCYVTPEHPQPGDNLDKLQIYQITKGGCEYRFMNYDYSKSRIHAADYSSVYIANLPEDYDLDRCFQEFNAPNRPLRNHMCSLSTSDIVVTTKNGKETAYYVDSIGFKDVSHLLPELHEVEAQRQKEQVQDEPER